MSNKIVLMTNGNVGQVLLKAAENTLSQHLPDIECLTVNAKPKIDHVISRIQKIIDKFSEHHILILTDLYGSTPCNIASQLVEEDHVEVISGVNLGMLIRAINYIERPFNDLIEKAVEGGINSIKHLRAVKQ